MMNITCNRASGRVPVTVLALAGALDGSSYEQLIVCAQEAYGSGARHMLIDMNGLSFISSAGLLALHSIARLLRGEPLPNLENGWGAFHDIERDSLQQTQPQIKLLKPQGKVERVLQTSGMAEYFEIHQDLQTAVGSF